MNVISKPAAGVFEWTGNNYLTSHSPPRQATLFEWTGPRGQRRVMAYGDYQEEQRRFNPQYNWATIWLYSEDGTLDGDLTGEWTLRQAA